MRKAFSLVIANREGTLQTTYQYQQSKLVYNANYLSHGISILSKTVAEVFSQTQQNGKCKIVEYSFWMLKQGHAKSTIKGRTKLLKHLTKLRANLYDSESIKETVSKQKWSIGRKANAIDAYTCFLQMQGLKWTQPFYKKIRKLPFILTETEIDQLIAACNKRMTTFLQLLKETGVRCGEACNYAGQT